MVLSRISKATLTPFHLDHGDRLEFTLKDGRLWVLELMDTTAWIRSRCVYGGGAKDFGKKAGEIGSYAFNATVRINGVEHVLERIVGEQASFYEPWEIDGVTLWLDAVACCFEVAGGFMAEKDWGFGYICRPALKARFAVHEGRICPERVHLWYPNTKGQLDISECYTGEDCWMGAYSGASAHCGLDVNMPKGTPLYAPIRLDTHRLFNGVRGGYNTNRWRGVRGWENGSEWQLQCHHLLKLVAEERTPLEAGAFFGTGAGTGVGLHPHSHFMFKVQEEEGEYWLDPWIIFWQAFRDERGSLR